jgi:hypothetical protein
MSYLRYLCSFARCGVQHILCCVFCLFFVCLRLLSYAWCCRRISEITPKCNVFYIPMLIALWKTSSLQHERRQEFKHTYTIPNIWDDIAIHLKHETNLTCYWSAWTKQGSELSCLEISFNFNCIWEVNGKKCCCSKRTKWNVCLRNKMRKKTHFKNPMDKK